MPKQSYGKIPQGRSQTLLFSLLDFANDALDADEVQLERLRATIKVHWQSPRRLVVQTKLRHLQALTVLTPTPLTLPQLKTALKDLENFLGILEDHRTMIRGSDAWYFSLNFWGDRWAREENLQQFEQAWAARRSETSGQKTEDSQNNSQRNHGAIHPDWPSLCREALDTHLTSNPLTAGDGMAFELADLYVPLGVTADHKEEDPPSYDPKDFLAQYHHLSHNRLAIIGEPGAGKTTFLQQLALALSATDDLPIWIPLADMGGRSLETYLFEVWLKQLFKQFTIEPKIQTEFAELIQNKRVWLFLDALDEMGDNFSQASLKLDRELQGWLGNASVILSCRSAVWDTGKNALTDFVIHRCQGFSEDAQFKQVQRFIQQWFREQPQLGDRLYGELNRSIHSRIRGVVRQPLYLTLLCRTWQLTQGKLPGTKAILYRQFVEAFYDWKQDTFPTTQTQRKQLNQILGQCALKVLQKNPPKARFRQAEIQLFFDAVDPNFFTLALQLGWLKRVNRSATTGENVYAFYHLTFQEYFAATAIAHWEIFIDEGGGYPIFSFAWQETILLWLGREEIAASEKEAFLQALLHWQDHCGGFYGVRATCFAGKALAEFPEFSQGQAVIDQLVQWRFVTAQRQPKLPSPMVEEAGIALSRSDRQRVVATLERFLTTHPHSFDRWLAAHSLGKNHDFGNPTAIASLEHLLTETVDPNFQLNLCRSLGAIAPDNPLVVASLICLLAVEQKATIRRKAALRLGKLQPNHPQAIATLLELAATSPQARATLQEICPDHPSVQTDTISQTLPARRRTAKRISERSLQPKSSREQALASQSLLKKLNKETNLDQRTRLVARLSAYVPDHPEIIPNLLTALRQARRKSTLKLAVDTLGQLIDLEQLPLVLPQVKHIYQTVTPNSPNRRYCYKLLWDWSKTLPYEAFQQAWSSC